MTLHDAAMLNVFTSVAYRLLWVRGLAWYGCSDGELALQDLYAAVEYAPTNKRVLALRCLSQMQQRLAKRQLSSGMTLPGSEDENASTFTPLCDKRRALFAEVSSTATTLPAKRARTHE